MHLQRIGVKLRATLPRLSPQACSSWRRFWLLSPQGENTVQAPPSVSVFDLSDVHLLEGPFRHAMEMDQAYILVLKTRSTSLPLQGVRRPPPEGLHVWRVGEGGPLVPLRGALSFRVRASVPGDRRPPFPRPDKLRRRSACGMPEGKRQRLCHGDPGRKTGFC